MSDEPTFKNGRKFFSFILSYALLGMGMVMAFILQLNGYDNQWLVGILMILASNGPVYIGGNVYQKGVEAKK